MTDATNTAADARTFADLVIAAETHRGDSQKDVAFHRDNQRSRDELMGRVLLARGLQAWTEVEEAARPLIAAALRA